LRRINPLGCVSNVIGLQELFPEGSNTSLPSLVTCKYVPLVGDFSATEFPWICSIWNFAEGSGIICGVLGRQRVSQITNEFGSKEEDLRAIWTGVEIFSKK